MLRTNDLEIFKSVPVFSSIMRIRISTNISRKAKIGIAALVIGAASSAAGFFRLISSVDYLAHGINSARYGEMYSEMVQDNLSQQQLANQADHNFYLDVILL